jgi:ribonuclease Z
MECFLLGSGGMMPMPARRLTSVLVRTEHQDYLLDAGEGVQVSLKELGLGIKRVGVVAITHLHADHCLGLPGVLMLRAQVDEPGPLTLVGPVGLERFVNHVVRDLKCHITFPMKFVEVNPANKPGGVALAVPELEMQWAPLNHSVGCVGYRLQEHTRPGRFSPERARALKVPEGPLWGKIQRGEPVRAEDGGTVQPDQVLGPPRKGRAVCLATDTRPCPGVDRLLEDADLAFLEGMFLEDASELAADKMHMPVAEAADAARRSRVRKLVLVHISPRYSDAQRSELKACARKVFPGAVVGRDLMSFKVDLPENHEC